MMCPSITHNRWLYGGVATGCVFLVISALGGGLFKQTGFWMADWQHQAFRMLCHQDPARSFWINGKPMAVCARCFGIYAGFTLPWLGLPWLAAVIRFVKIYAGYLLVAAIVLNVFDVVVNLLGIWQNTLVTRAVTGGFIGIAVVLFLADKFVTSINKSQRGVYGINRTTNYRS